MSIFQETWTQENSQALPPGHHVIWVQSGSMTVNGAPLEPDQGVYVNGDSLIDYAAANTLRFTIAQDTEAAAVSENNNRLSSSTFDIEAGAAVLRLDRVTFPAGAIAYRHTHAGAGIRYLLCGELQVIADDHSQQMEAGQCWFEDAYSPVKAIAADDGITEFIRVMVLPEAFEGKPTIKRLNAEDMEKPTLQTNHRYFDQVLHFAA